MRFLRLPPTLFLILCFCLAFLPQRVDAVPGFAKDTGMTCSSCHTVWPQLNETGRQLKETGYSSLSLNDIDENLALAQASPLSGRLNLRLIDKRTSKLSTSDELSDSDKALKVRALHEVELFFAGRAGERVSFFAEIEAEDEWPDPNGVAPGFQAQIANGVAQVMVNENLRAYCGYASPFYADAYNTLNYNKPDRRGRAWQKTDSFLPDPSQVIGLAGRANKVSGLVAWHGNPGELEGKDARDFTGRLAVDAAEGIMVGGWADYAQSPPFADEYDKTLRAGVDAQVNVENLSVNVLAGIIDQDPATKATKADDSGTQDNNISIEAMYYHEVSAPRINAIVPIVAIDRYTVSDGDDDFLNLGVFLTAYYKDNWRSQIGWEGNLSAPDSYEHKESRITAVLDLGF